jgi:hypothetical protein
MDERVRRAGLLYERVVFTGDDGPLAEADWELDAAEADLAVARGRLIHARFLLRRDQDPAAAEEDPGAVPVQPTAVRVQEHRPTRAFADGQVDRPGGPRRQRDSHDLAALTGDR